MDHIRRATLYSHYACGVYDMYPDALFAAEKLVGGRSGTYDPMRAAREENNGTAGAGASGTGTEDDDAVFSLFSCYRLSDFGFPRTAMVYATFANDILATSYCILVDEVSRSVVVSVKGTGTLEDMVTDLQFSSADMKKVGEVCGFDGCGKYAHRGMLAKCKWICNDLKRRKILSRLLATDGASGSNNPCRDFDFVFTGHSLGAGIAAILSTMFKPSYPEVKCYAFCPPGCTVSLNLALECEEYVTSIVVGNDVIPRIRDANFEMLRFDFLEILARVRVPKMKALRDIRMGCRNQDLEARNKKLLYPKDCIPSSEYYKKFESFRQKRKRAFEELSPTESRLNIPGRIIHLVHAMDGNGKCSDRYLPMWESLQNLREIDLSIEIMKQHSIENLVNILEVIAKDYANASQGISEEGDDASQGSNNVHAYYSGCYDNDFSADDRWFVLCSRPHGSVSLIPTLISVAAFCCSALSNNTCSLYFREAAGGNIYYSSNATKGTVEYVAGISLGFYTWGVEYYDVNVDDHVLQCSPNTPENIENDVYIKMARGFAALGLIVGFFVMCCISLANCMAFSRKSFQRISVAFFFVTGFQAMSFIFLRSDHCDKDLFPDLPGVDLQPCRLDTGSNLSVASTVMWFLAAIFTAYIDRASIVEEQLKILSMHAMESY